MPKALTIRSRVEDGRVSKTASGRLRSHLRLFEGGDVEITIRRPRRSLKQNAYYFGVVLPAIQSALAESGTAVSVDAIHEVMKSRHLPPRQHEAFGETLVLPASSAALDSTDFHDFIEAVRQDEDVLALGCYIPDPNES